MMRRQREMGKMYIDQRGWKYKVLPGLGENTFKARYCKPGKTGYHCCQRFPWRDSIEAAQVDLDNVAALRGWREIIGD